MTPMYESGSTRWYRLGRTDTIRNTTREAHTFIRAMQNPRASVSWSLDGGPINYWFHSDLCILMQAKEKANALQAAVKAHSQATVEVCTNNALCI